MTLVKKSSTFPVPPAALFAFHLDAANLAAISPPLPPFRMLSALDAPTVPGAEQVFRLGFGRIGVTWRARIVRVEPNRLLEDVQEAGPFRRWRHQHQVTAEGIGSRLTDVVSFSLVPGPLGGLLDYWLVRPGVVAMFTWRHRRTQRLLRKVR